MRYTYLVASLPMLQWGGRPPLELPAFRTQCAGNLSTEDEAELDAILEDRPEEGDSEFARAWTAVEAQIRNSAARWRAGRRRIDAGPFLREEPALSGYLESAISDALGKENPLEREEVLDQARWQAAEDLALQDPFGLAPVLAFGVKLKLLERWHSMDAEAGSKRVESFISEQLAERGIKTEFEVEVD